MDSSASEKLKSELILNELKQQRHDKEVVDVDVKQIKVVIFRCGTHNYSFYGSDIREILPSCEIFWTPSLPEYILGLINIRGDVESVIALHSFLGEEKVEGNQGLIAMAVHGDFRSGIIIDQILDVIDIPVDAIRSPLATLHGAARELVTGQIDYCGNVVALLDIGKLAIHIST